MNVTDPTFLVLTSVPANLTSPMPLKNVFVALNEVASVSLFISVSVCAITVVADYLHSTKIPGSSDEAFDLGFIVGASTVPPPASTSILRKSAVLLQT